MYMQRCSCVIKIIRTNINAHQDGVEIADIDGGGEGANSCFTSYISLLKNLLNKNVHIFSCLG